MIEMLEPSRPGPVIPSSVFRLLEPGV